MLKKLTIIPIAIAGTLLLCAIPQMILTAKADEPAQSVNTQTYTPARFAVAAAEIHVANLQNSELACQRKILFKLDSATGEVSILQMSVRGNNDPTVLSAVWCSTLPGGQFQLFGAPGNMNQ